jgi:ABC-2 type transport system permease protein
MDIKNAGIAFLDMSNDEITEQLSNKIISSGFFVKTENLISYNDIDKILKKGETKAVVAFEKDFGKKLIGEGKADLSIIADGSDPNAATLITNYITAIVGDFNMSVAGGVQAKVIPEVRMFYNPSLKSY